MSLSDRVCGPVRQRFLLVVMCFIGVCLTTVSRLNNTVLMRAVYNEHMDRQNTGTCPAVEINVTHSSGMEEFLWGTKLQLYISMGWPLGYFLGRFPAGLIADWMGAKTLFGYSVFIPAVCTILTPICARTSPYLMMTNRIINGIFLAALVPTIAWMGARWFPERSIGAMLGATHAGFPLGCMLLFAFIHGVNFLFEKWVAFYYITGVVTILYLYFWQAFVWDDPFEHPYITIKELEMLVDNVPMYATDTELERGWFWPWKSILTSRSVWGLMLAETGFSWFIHFTTVSIPEIYFEQIHDYHFIEHEVLGLAVYALMAFTVLLGGVVSDRLIEARYFTITHITKAYYSISSIVGSVLFIGMVHAECRLTTVILYYLAASACMGLSLFANVQACLSVAPNFVGTIVSLTTLMGMLTYPVQLQVVNTFTTEGTLNEWKTVSYMNGAFCLLTTAIFLKVGKCSLEPWNKPKGKRTPLEVDYESEAPSTPLEVKEGLDAVEMEGNKSQEMVSPSKITEPGSETQVSEPNRSLGVLSRSRSQRSRRRNDVEMPPKGESMKPRSQEEVSKAESNISLRKGR